MLYNQLNVHGIIVDLISVHPVAPINQAVLNHRNKQLDHICAFTNSLSKKNKILVGDFNLSNWSPKYDEFIDCLVNMTNTAKGQGMNFTWSGKLFSRSPEFKTHIDHIFISNNLKLLNYDVLGRCWLDHNLILVTIKL